ncbi:hypothetical protein APR04_001719 [Promicromonospora umidemergens]|uniref:Uncharacterized protein n=1 Tax=Promicromonospora umidemergens TaxID=629679 RepID=A0ABP8XFT9_9MICO|nr:hypothetical protein [Promicromonospora umidemergens]MCP2282816.1 hypothetical protein [Promicromonospora umidemergens]
MNPHGSFPQHGRGPRSGPAQPTAPASSPDANPAAYDDAARRKTAQRKTPGRSTKDPQVTWIRAGDLPTVLTGRVLARGVDLHAALVRRALRRPTAAAKKAAGAAKRLVIPSRTPQSPETSTAARTSRVRESRPQQGTEGMGI